MRSESITPIAINLVNVHVTAGEILVVRELKAARGAIEGERGGLRGIVRIVGGEANFFFEFGDVKQQKSVIDAQRREANQMDDRRTVVLDVGDELIGLAFLEAVTGKAIMMRQ